MRKSKTKSRSLMLTASTAICALPIQLAAQDSEGGFMLEEAPEQEEVEITTSSVELGVGWVSEDSFKFGEYSGHENDGLFGVANVDILRRAPYDSDSTEYWSLTGTNLGLESRSVRAEYGQQGKFKIFGEYDQIPHFRFDDGETPFRGSGGTNLTLPPGWVAADQPADFAALSQSLQGLDIETERQRLGGGFSVNITEELELTASYQREEKNGLETVAGIFGTTGGNMRSVILPKPIDYTTDEMDVALAYSGERLQAQLSYHLSMFDNNQDSLTWANPYTAVAGEPSQSFAQGGQGRMALEPDNSAHQLALSAAYLLSPTMRLAGNFAYGRMFQNDDFLAYTINPNLNVPAGLPRDDLDGDVTTMHGKLIFTARPTPKSNIKVAYTFDDRDNDTPRDVYLTVPNDTGDQGTVDSSRARINRPYSRQSHEVNLDADYKILPSTRLGLGYDFETVDRDFTEVEDTYEHTGRIKVRSSPFSFGSGWLEYQFSTRDGSEYKSNQPFLVSHTDEFLGTLTDEAEFFENNPFLRKFYIADRRRHLISGGITAMPSEQLVLGLTGSYNMSNYHNTEIGLTDMKYGSITGDVAFMPNEALTLTGFLTFERAKYEQTGFERQGFGPGGSITPDSDLDALSGGFTTNGFWDMATTDNVITVGAGVEWTAIEDRLSFSADYAFSRSNTDFDLSARDFSSSGLPDLKTKLHSFGISGEYKVKENLSARLGYRFEYFDVDDFALDGVDEAVPTVLTLGNDSPNYNAHVVWASMVLHF